MWAKANLHLSRRILVEWPKNGFTFDTVELDVFELGEHTRASGDHTRDAYERVEMRATEIAQGCDGWELGDPNVNLGVNALVRRIVEEDYFEGNCVEYTQHLRGAIG